jgi:hypothetical protein
MIMNMDPCQSPATSSAVTRDQGSGNLPMADGKCLVVASKTVLPPICIRTNQPVSEGDMVCRQFHWCPPWVGLLIVLSGLLLIFVYFIVRKECSLTFGLDPRLRKKYQRRVLLKVVAAIALFFAMPFSVAIDVTVLPIIALVLFLVAIVSLFVGNSPLSVAKYRNGMFWIKGFSDEFLTNVDVHSLS